MSVNEKAISGKPFWKGFFVACVVGGLVTFSFQIDAKKAFEKLWHKKPSAAPLVSIRAYDFSPLVEKVKPSVINLYVEGKVAPPPPQQNYRRHYQRNPLPNPFDYDYNQKHDSPFQNQSDSNGVDKKEKVQEAQFNPFFRYFNPRRNTPKKSRGTGFLINDQGYAITNYHVVKNAGKIKAQLHDGVEYDVKVIGKAQILDLALVKLQAKKGERFPFAFLGDSNTAKVGEPVIAIGNARGLGFSVTAGIISAKGRFLPNLKTSFNNYIQTDAEINFGNSGGPLFNVQGEVIGVNTAILRNGRGIGFSIPINIAKKVIWQLKKYGKIQRAQLGVMIQQIDSKLAKSLGLKSPKGALINRVEPGSPAARAKIRVGDVILEVDGNEVSSYMDLPRLIGLSPVGSKVVLTILRKNQTLKIKVRLSKFGSKGTSFGDNRPNSEPNPSSLKSLDSFGLTVISLTDAERKELNLSQKGVKVQSTFPQTPAFNEGVKVGDIILEANRKDIATPQDLADIVSKTPKGDNVLLLIRRGTTSLFIAVTIE